MSTTKFYIIFARGDRNSLMILELTIGNEFELENYIVASRRDFSSYDEAYEYAAELAKKHNKSLESENKNTYLD